MMSSRSLHPPLQVVNLHCTCTDNDVEHQPVKDGMPPYSSQKRKEHTGKHSPGRSVPRAGTRWRVDQVFASACGTIRST